MFLPLVTPAPTIVSKKGGAKYTSISEALRDTSSNIYYIYGGNYTEVVQITRSDIRIYGETTDRSTYGAPIYCRHTSKMTYLNSPIANNKVTISRNMPASIAGSNDASATVQIGGSATDVRRASRFTSSTGPALWSSPLTILSLFSVYNLNIENTYGKPANQSQAVALSARGTRFGVYGCQVRGYQDTLLANNVRSTSLTPSQWPSHSGPAPIFSGFTILCGISESYVLIGSSILLEEPDSRRCGLHLGPSRFSVDHQIRHQNGWKRLYYRLGTLDQ